MKITVAKLIAIGTLLGMSFTGIFWIDSRYAKCQETKVLEKRFNLFETGTILQQKQSRLWQYEDRYGKDPAKVSDPNTRQEMKQLQVDVPNLQKKMNMLEGMP